MTESIHGKSGIEEMDMACVKNIKDMSEAEVRAELENRRELDNKFFDVLLTSGVQSGRKKKGKMQREIRAKEDDTWHMFYDNIIEQLPYEFFRNRSDAIRGFCRLGAFITALQMQASAESGDINYGYMLPECGKKYRKFVETCMKLTAIYFKEHSREIEDRFQEILSTIYDTDNNISLQEIESVKELGGEFREIFDNKNIARLIDDPKSLRLIMGE